METQTILFLVTVIGCFVGLGGWLSGRDNRIESDSKWKGTIDAKLDVILGIDKRVTVLEGEVKEHSKAIAVMDQSTKSAHHRIDSLEGK